MVGGMIHRGGRIHNQLKHPPGKKQNQPHMRSTRYLRARQSVAIVKVNNEKSEGAKADIAYEAHVLHLSETKKHRTYAQKRAVPR